MTDKIKIGITCSGYNETRNITSLSFRNYKVVRRYDLMNLLDHAYFRLYKKNNPYFHWVHRDLGINDVKLFHFFNKISFSSTPWISTFETCIPYFSKPSEKFVRTLTSKYCKKLIAMSNRAYCIEMERLSSFPQIRQEVEHKIVTLHPPQASLIKDYTDKLLSKEYISFVFTGRDFFRKGGMEMLNTFARLIEEKKPVKLTIISSLDYGDYVSLSTSDDLKKALDIIKKYPQNIIHLKSLPNKRVLDLFCHSHVALLPSFHESYGYSILEAQAAGCPVITTDISAIPEINSNECGWLLLMPKNEFREGKWRTRTDKNIFSRLLEEQLYNTITKILDAPSMIKNKGEKALERIKREHDPQSRVDILEKIYTESI